MTGDWDVYVWKARAQDAEADRDRLRARVAEVEAERDRLTALVDEYRSESNETWTAIRARAEAAEARLAEVEAELTDPGVAYAIPTSVHMRLLRCVRAVARGEGDRPAAICEAGASYECAERGCYAANVGVPEACHPIHSGEGDRPAECGHAPNDPGCVLDRPAEVRAVLAELANDAQRMGTYDGMAADATYRPADEGSNDV